jgi:hexosaminidase
MTTRTGIALALLLAAGCAPAAVRPPSLLPLPRQLTARPGSFEVTRTFQVLVQPDSPAVRTLAELFAAPLREATGWPVPVQARRPGDSAPERSRPEAARPDSQEPAGEPPAAGALVLRVVPDTTSSPEAYTLDVAPESIQLTAPTPLGLARGLQTLRQLLPPAYERAVQRTSAAAWGVAQLPPEPVKAWRIPALRVDDAPRFSYRGLHLDVGRHFFPPAFVKQYIDLLAAHRLNTFHWHLTEDQGWRIDIRQYPLLATVGGCRKETMVGENFNPYIGDNTPYCGYYTQEEVKDIVAYAAARQITIIPEIEMPGHSLAAIAAYPELSCEPARFEVATKWGIFEPIYCPSEETFTFLQNVLDEVLALFPSRYIHIGGDEAPKNLWQKNPVAQQVIKREGLQTEAELQSYFVRRIERFLSQRGRRLIGWDEILEGGLPPAATVMSWRGTAGGIEAAKEGHDVVMAPTSHVYLDYYQGDPASEPFAIGGFTPLEKVYSFEPVPTELTAEEAKHVLGAQGNVWTEYIPTSEHALYMAWPRAAAIAEVTWTAKEQRDYADFTRRLGEHFRRLDMLGLPYRLPDVQGVPDSAAARTTGELRLELRSLHPDVAIHYTLDGTEPTSASARARGAFTIRVPEQGLTLRVRSILPNGRMSSVQVLKLGS